MSFREKSRLFLPRYSFPIVTRNLGIFPNKQGHSFQSSIISFSKLVALRDFFFFKVLPATDFLTDESNSEL